MNEEIEYGPKQPFSQDLHQTKYRQKGEDFKESMSRQANAQKDGEDHYRAYRQLILEMKWLPPGRVQAAMGAARRVTPYNCFVSRRIPDSMAGIMAAVAEAAETMRMGGGIGYDFSTLRPRGDHIRSLDSKSSGALSFMGIFDALCKTISSSGHRRGAQMGVLRVDHPDIEEFVHSKQNLTNLSQFNISIGVTDRFMQCVKDGTPFELKFEGRVYKTIDASELWEQVMRSTWNWADPGVLFMDRINEMNNLYYCETIAATNPCGEQPLPPYGACLLGSQNLAAYIIDDGVLNGGRRFDWVAFTSSIPTIVRAMDNVIDRATYPLTEQEFEAKDKRRMGLGVAGLANAAEALGYTYGGIAMLAFTEKVMKVMTNEAYRASTELAREKGPFPAYSPVMYPGSQFIKRLDEDVQDAIKEYGIRNSHLISIAPTGTISLCADNISSGIEPVWSYEYDRIVQTFDGPVTVTVKDYGWNTWGVKGKLATQCTAEEHLDVLIACTKWVDSAVSKTCNVSPDMAWDSFKQIYMTAWEHGCKGITTFNPGGKRFGILETPTIDQIQEEEGGACYVDLETGSKECS